MDVKHVANRCCTWQACRSTANVQFLTVMATKMPFVWSGVIYTTSAPRETLRPQRKQIEKPGGRGCHGSPLPSRISTGMVLVFSADLCVSASLRWVESADSARSFRRGICGRTGEIAQRHRSKALAAASSNFCNTISTGADTGQ
jgi:hypothetical protein